MGRVSTSEPLVFGLSHVDVPVRDLERALAVYRDVLGFTVKARGEGWIDVESAGTVVVRLVETTRFERRATLRVLAGTVEATLDALVRAGCRLVYPTFRSPQQELAGVVHDPDGNTLTIWRALTEDEYDTVPALPTTLTWTEDADALLKSLLKRVPALFRALARRRVASTAEELAGARNLVTREEVIRGFILSSPKVTRGRNRAPLVEHGIDVDAYQADWDAD